MAASGRGWIRWAFLGAVVLVVGWVVAGVLSVFGARAAAEDGLDDLREVRATAGGDVAEFVSSMEESGLDASTAGVLLRSARDNFRDAEARAGSVWTAPLRILPVAGRQVRSVDAMAASAATVTTAAADAFVEMGEVLNADVADPADRVAALGATGELLADLDVAMDAVDLGPSEALVGPLSRARRRFAEEYDEARGQLDQMIAGVAATERLLAGPSRYLLVASNNAEMRAGSGMFLQVGPLTVDGGRFDLGDLESTRDLRLTPPGVAVDPDVEARWGFLAPGWEWRNTNLTPRFDESARIVTEMWAELGRGEVDGVISVDVVALGYLLEVVGPVVVDGEELTAAEVQTEFFLEQYAAFGGDREGREERYDRLGRIAEAIFAKFDEGGWSPEDLLRQVERASRGRHLLMWSADELEQAGWEATSVSGQVEPDSMLVSILNRGANKLDPYLEAEAVADYDPETGRMALTVEITNDAPEGLPIYVAGPAPDSGLSAGDYFGYLALTFPGGSKGVEISGRPVVASGPDGPTQVIASELRIPRATSTSVEVAFTVPDVVDEIRIEASARPSPTQWRFGDRTFDDGRARTIDLSR